MPKTIPIEEKESEYRIKIPKPPALRLQHRGLLLGEDKYFLSFDYYHSCPFLKNYTYINNNFIVLFLKNGIYLSKITG